MCSEALTMGIQHTKIRFHATPQLHHRPDSHKKSARAANSRFSSSLNVSFEEAVG
jgi:hypothetical protein